MSDLPPTSILQNVGLPNTLSLPVRARKVLLAESVSVLQQGLGAAGGEPVFVLGGGSNVVLPSVVNRLTVWVKLKGIWRQASEGNTGVFDVAAGESWQGFVKFCIGQGLGGGIENLSLIPGTVGGAPIQNIGAYGVEVAQFIRAVQVLDMQSPGSAPIILSKEECNFGYRDSLFKQQPGRWLVLQVRFAVPHAEHARRYLDYAGIAEALERSGCRRVVPATIAEAVAKLRRAKLPDPRRQPNAGSFFKNPVLSAAQLTQLRQTLHADAAGELAQIPSWPHAQGRKLAAAALIERTGFKRRPAETVGVWYRQPLVLLNLGGATTTTVVAYADEIRQKVEARFGVRLEQEPVQVQAD